MRIMAGTRTFVVLGTRPVFDATELFADVATGGEAFLLALGSRPTLAQQVVTEEALALAADRRFVLTAETVADPAMLRERLDDAGTILIAASRGERRRWNLGSERLSVPGARSRGYPGSTPRGSAA
jgi:hypothetical protein